MVAATEPLYDGVRAWYNFKEERLDLQFRPRDQQTPRLMITYEHGYPWQEDHAEWEPLQRQALHFLVRSNLLARPCAWPHAPHTALLSGCNATIAST